MNSEIYGHVTDLPWGFIFERRGEELAKHPTQLYEALCYLVTFVAMFFAYWKTKAKEKQGLLFGMFLIGVFGSRFMIEFVKENQEAWEQGMTFNMGQLLSIPFVIAGVYFIYNAMKKK